MRFSYVRELDEYPTGARRMRILTMAVLAILIGSYEAQIAPVVPLLLKDLEMSLATYGAVSAAAALAGAVASIVGGRLTDRVGRVRLLVPLMMLTALCCFAMTLVHSPRDLLIARIVLAFVDGVAMASTAPLVRDFSPRLGRAQAFGFWTWGPVGANFLAAAVAGWTLPIFNDSWRSQFVIMGLFSLVISVVIALNIADLSPELRAMIQHTERDGLKVVDTSRPPRVRSLFASRAIWAHVVGISLWLVLYITLSLFGQTMLVGALGVSTAEASTIMAAFWILDLIMLIVIGRVSDRTGLRKPFSLGGTVAAVLVTGYLAIQLGSAEFSTTSLMVTGALLGGSLGVAYAPWMANYSENAEDVDPRLQGTAWGLFGFLSKVIAVAGLLLIPHVVEATSWQTWLWISLACLALFIPAILLFDGPWRRPRRPAAAGPAVKVASGAE
ncbi:OPA family glycerol-3-phosphate transporter-like MFS transporter [Thermocatellispora tengchongensis]|uniref:OPA family glycerol-3-phosphate transporter-like MFS transporter n=1 Tax=Thermocatellispora tengchongensis TaxID=1073253 RepID=A0A840NTW2_9ACTN|nr:MFS transporter [Thermocatellispora tengchongensis]MBB5132174.1 OPA family glycerol-3-phosphate transporter-like MFS transporter [Thermocatellispora tengchongensis]